MKIDDLRTDTYREACKLLKKYGKCAIIRPTGFGKTGLLTRFIKSGKYKNILYLYPSDTVKHAVLDFYYGVGCDKRKGIPGVKFMTYMKLARLTGKDTKKLRNLDLIICDECHRMGAVETMEGLNLLLGSRKNVPLLGATATPERMDMVDPIAMFFDDHVTSRYTLHDAFQDGILRRPYYCFCAYGESEESVLDAIKKESRLEPSGIDYESRSAAKELLEARAVEIARISRMEEVIPGTLKEAEVNTTYQKYIVFFRDFKHLHKSKSKVKGWFHKAFPEHKIRELTIISENEDLRNNTKKLDSLTYKENHIDLIYSCDMLNMGYHVDGLTGILMYRGTHSGTVYIQQLGRALSTGDLEPKIVFDIVDNLHRKSVYSTLSERIIQDCDGRVDENGTPIISRGELMEYDELVRKSRDRDSRGKLIPLTTREKNRLIKLGKLVHLVESYRLGKRGANIIKPADLVVTSYAATYRELIAKTVAEETSMLCRQAWTRWVEKGGDDSIMTRDYILGQKAPEAVPLPPFCRLKNVSVNAVLDEMGVTA